MYDKDNVFAKILKNQIPCHKVYEDEISLFFYDINPIAKIHVLGIPKKRCVDFYDFIEKADSEYISSFFASIKLVIKTLGIKESGFRIVSNSGSDGGQEVPHFHIHILAGEKIGPLR